MSVKRVVVVYCAFMAMACTLVARIFVLVNDTELSRRVVEQTTATVELTLDRPDFYDRNGQKLTGAEYVCVAVVDPENVSGYNLLSYVEDDQTEKLTAGLSGTKPFTVTLNRELPDYSAVPVVRSEVRYSDGLPLHIIGYLNGDGEGAAGLELIFERSFAEQSVSTVLSYQVDAAGRKVAGAACVLSGGSVGAAGVSLTIDRDIQLAVNSVAQGMLASGAIVVTDCESGEIVACASMPEYNPYNVAAALDGADGALLNRAFLSYNAGSVFKMVVQAAALECGISPDYSYECCGSITVGDTTFCCMNGHAHGVLDMESALAVSCNCYHIALAREIGAQTVRNMAVSLGFSSSTVLYEGYSTVSGILPTAAELENVGELCNFAFGQGRLQVTPLQIAAYINCIANGGIYRPCSLILSVNGEAREQPDGIRVMSEQTAAILRKNMLAVIAQGTGRAAQPENISAAGKSSTAETGIVGSGKAVIVTWFAGFFPADSPKYSVTVISEMDAEGAVRASSVFRETVEAIAALYIAQ